MANVTASAAAAAEVLSAPPVTLFTLVSSTASSSGVNVPKKEAIAQLVGLLEDSRQADTNSYDKQLADLRKKRYEKKKGEKVAGGSRNECRHWRRVANEARESIKGNER